MSAEIIQFIPRPHHNRETDFPTYAYKGGTADYILGLDKKLKEKAVEIINVALVDIGHCKSGIGDGSDDKAIAGMAGVIKTANGDLLVEGPHENAIWGPNGFLPKEPA